MKNKINFKKYLIVTFIISIILSTIFVFLNIYEYNVYKQNFNNKVALIISKVKDKYPFIDNNDIVEILNNKEKTNDLFKEYGILESDSYILENKNAFNTFLIINISYLIISIIIILFVYLHYEKNKRKEIKEITKLVERINNSDYQINLNDLTEDELSILKNEIYKTTIILKERAELSHQDKLELKKSLEDISHQLKTPLTSMLIILDNLIDDANMPKNLQEEFIHDLKREVLNINFLVQNLLKLTKFDVNTVKFNKRDVLVSDLIKEVMKNTATLSDLKNIVINVKGNKKIKLNIDFNWQIEALTNILKNCLEHSYNDSEVDIEYSDNKAYTKIDITDYGVGITKKDLPHIFERFYQSENALNESMGIGLSLAKSIIEKDNGKVFVTSNNNKTTFTIKYFKV